MVPAVTARPSAPVPTPLPGAGPPVLPAGPPAAAGAPALLLRAAAALLLPIAAAALALEAVVRGDLATAPLWRLLAVPEQVPEAALHHARVLACLYAGADPGAGFSADEAAHLREVAGVLSAIRRSGEGAAALLMLITALAPRRALQALGDGARLGAALALALALLALQWGMAFRLVHPLVFAGAAGEWDFPPDALLVRLYPDGYFAGVLAAVAALWLALLAAAGALARWRLGPPPRRPWAWGRRHGWLALAGAGALPLWAEAGYHLWRWQGPAATGADAVLGLVLLGALGALFAGSRASAALALGAGCAAWLALGLGVRLACAEADRVAARGDAVVAALGHFRARTGAWPERLDALVPAELPALPAVTVGRGQWYYVREGDAFWLGFQGPLAWMYEYASPRGSWNLQPH
jgi:hypothetical protein